MKGGEGMVDFYTFLVIDGLKPFKRVPKHLKAEVKNRLEELDKGSLAVEDETSKNT